MTSSTKSPPKYSAPEVAVFEVEFKSELEAEQYMPPDFVGEEVTHNASYSGAVLAASVA